MARARTSAPAARKPASTRRAAPLSATTRSAAAKRASRAPVRVNGTAAPTPRSAATTRAAAVKPAAVNSAAVKRTASGAAKVAATKASVTKAAATKAAATKATAAKAAVAKATAAKTAAASAAKAAAAKAAAAKAAAANPESPKPPAPRATVTLSGGSSVVKVLDSKRPVEALRKFLSRIDGEATREEGQIALGSAQLMLLPIAHEHRGGNEVKQLLDLVLARWDAFPDRAGFHAQEFLRNAFAAVGDDRARIARLETLVPSDATSELRFNMAGAHAVAGNKPAMLRALEDALAVGATAAQVRRDPDFARYVDDPAVVALLDRAAVPAIPVDIAPHVAPIRAALDTLVGTLRGLGEITRFHPPANLDAILAAERATKIQLPNDYRALLTITDGMAMWDHEFFSTRDYHGDTSLAARARAFLEMSVSYGGIGMDECVPLANWGQPNNWLLYDPRGSVREGDPGYVVMLTADPWPMADLADALLKIEDSVRDVLATN